MNYPEVVRLLFDLLIQNDKIELYNNDITYMMFCFDPLGYRDKRQ